EDVLAAVLAHEVTHVAKQHGLKSIRAGTILDRLLDQGVPLASIDCAQVFLQGSLLFASLVDDLVDNLVQKGYSREMEFEADAGALEITNYTGFNPQALDTMLSRLEEIEKDKSGGWFSTHPSPSERIAKADAVLGTLTTDEFFKGGLENRNKRFKKVMKSL
ncbi:MAG: peptidase M48, partial [Proteobacteria bacterium]|nr:peptidase M48 [Pseudomonadota bacterium]